MDQKDFLKETNVKFERTILWMVDIANTFYPMSEPDKKILGTKINELWSEFINDCENKEMENDRKE